MKQQLILDFSRPLAGVIDGKKTERMTFTASSDLKQFLTIIASKMDTTVSELCQKYIIEGLQKDVGLLLLFQANKDKALGELMKRY